MWMALLVRAMIVRLGRLPGVAQLLRARRRTRQSVVESHKAAGRAERLIMRYRQMDQVRRWPR